MHDGPSHNKCDKLNQLIITTKTLTPLTAVCQCASLGANIIIASKLNDKSDKAKCEFSYNYDIATYSAKTDI